MDVEREADAAMIAAAVAHRPRTRPQPPLIPGRFNVDLRGEIVASSLPLPGRHGRTHGRKLHEQRENPASPAVS